MGAKSSYTQIGEYLKQELESLSYDHEIIGTIPGKGLMRGIELVHNRETKEPAVGKAKEISLTGFKMACFAPHTADINMLWG